MSESDTNDYNISAAADAALNMIFSPEFPIVLSALKIDEKIEVACIADNIELDPDNTDIELASLFRRNVNCCGKAIIDSIDDFSNKEKLWVICEPETGRALYLPEYWNESIEGNSETFGVVVTTSYDSAVEIINDLEDKGVNAEFISIAEPNGLLSFLIEKYGFDWVCIVKDLDTFYTLTEFDNKNEIEMTKLIARYTQREYVKMSEYEEQHLSKKISEKLINAELHCVLKVEQRENEKILLFTTRKTEGTDNEMEFLPVYTSKKEIDMADIPFEHTSVRLPFSFIREIADELGIEIVINTEYDFFVVSHNIENNSKDVNYEDEINDLLKDIDDLK